MNAQTQYTLVTDHTGLIENNPAIGTLIDTTVEHLSQRLELDPPDGQPLRVVIQASGMSEVNHSGKIVIVMQHDGPYSDQDWFELIFRHELIHALAQHGWGNAPAIFWEGLPIYLADNVVRQRLFGFSYHQLCKALLAQQALLALSDLLLPDMYYGRRHDFRVGVESGSLIGYLVEHYGITPLRQFFQQYQPATPQRPGLIVNPLCSRAWGKPFQELEQKWQQFLYAQVSDHEAAIQRIANRSFPQNIPLKDRHCKFCYTPIQTSVCPVCQGSQDIEILII